MNYKLPLLQQVKILSSIDSYFDRTNQAVIPGAHRLQILLNDWLDQGILNIPSILITGSNGKGTTCAFIESILRGHNFKTGLYTSPHLIHPTERIRINGIPIDENILTKYLNIILESSNKYLPNASFFEIATATAFLIFFDQKIDFLICEVGLGGHFDSTNCLNPLVSVLTNVSLEHTEILGDKISQIASDKSYISRRNRPFIINTVSEEALQGINNTLKITGAKLINAQDKFTSQLIENVLYKIETSKQDFSNYFTKLNLLNLRVALCAINQIQIELQSQLNQNFKIEIPVLVNSIFKTNWPGRFDIRKINNRNIIFDASHNSDGFQYFLQLYNKSFFSEKKCILIFASLNDKDWKKTLFLLPKIAHSVIFTQIPSKRAQPAEDLAAYFSNKVSSDSQNKNISIYTIQNLDLALEHAMNHQLHELPIVITGSILFIGNAMNRFGISVQRGVE